MVTLKPYLDAMSRKKSQSAARPPLPAPWPEFATSLVDSVSRYVLEGEPYRDIREDLRLLSDSIRSAGQPPASSQAFDRSIQEFRRRFEDASQAQCRDMRRMLASLNEALILLASGSDRTLGALKQMETTLHQAATLNDISSLKSKVNEVIRLVAQETGHQRDDSSRAIAEMHNQITAGQKTFHTGPREYPDREPAVIAITSGGQERGNSAVAVFVLQRQPAIVARYGRDAASELLHTLIRDRIHPLAPETQAFAWSDDTAVLVLPAGIDWSDLKDQLRWKSEIPFEHRFVSGGRLATLKGSLSAAVLSVKQPVSQTVCDIDLFARSAGK